MLKRLWKISRQDYRTLGSTFGAVMFAFGLSLFLMLSHPGEAQAHERDFATSQILSPVKVISSIADYKVDGAAPTILSAHAPDESDCHGIAHAGCCACAGGHCLGCSAAALAAALGIGLAPVSSASVFPDQTGLALTKPDAAFRPPRSIL